MKLISLAAIVLFLISLSANAAPPAQSNLPRAAISYIEGGATFSLPVPGGTMRLRAVSDDVIEVKVTPNDVPAATRERFKSVTVTHDFPIKTTLTDTNGEFRFSTGRVVAAVDPTTGRVRFCDNSGRELLSETTTGRKFTKTKVGGEDSWTPEQSFVSPEGESLYGLGQHQDGRLDWRGETLRLRQANTEISVPFIWSTHSYGVLWDNPSDTFFNPGDEVALKDNKGVLRVAETGQYSLYLNHPQDAAQSCWTGGDTIRVDGDALVDITNKWVPYGAGGSLKLEAHRDYAVEVAGKEQLQLLVHEKTATTTWRSRVGESVDYYFVHGETPGKIIANYRAVSGQVPMLPKYAFGYWQCRERYGSSKELIDTVAEFRRRQIPVDVIVQDWQYWGKYGWNAMKWDEPHYPDVPLLTKTLHGQNAKLIVSVWPKFDPQTEVRKELTQAGGMVPGTSWFDASNPQAREIYWKYSRKAFFDQGVDGYWQDASEPDDSRALPGAKLYLGSGDRYLNAYPLFVNQTVYEGNRDASNGSKRLCDLTRSAYAGMQRYGTISWSGDVKGSWEAYQRQLPAALGFVSSGLPYWTADIGGFFRPGSPLGPKGDQYTSPDYRELLCRWLQCGTFYPVQRMHGYVSHTEPWNYGPETESVLVKFLKLRYQFLPYIYSCDWLVHSGGSLMKPLAMDFPQEAGLRNIKDEFLFGDALLVAPIMTPRAKDAPASVRQLVLPASAKWFDFWTGKPAGNGVISVLAPLDTIPLFFRAGSILPFGPELQYSGEKTDKPLELRVYPGADAAFMLYDDTGDGYNYETGEFTTVDLSWDDSAQILKLGKRAGTYPGMTAAQPFLVRILQADGSWKDRHVQYTGESMIVK